MPEHDTEGTTLPTCPACGCEAEGWYVASDLANDGDAAATECEGCGAEYWAVISVSYAFTTRPLAQVLAAELEAAERALGRCQTRVRDGHLPPDFDRMAALDATFAERRVSELRAALARAEEHERKRLAAQVPE